MFAHPYNSFDLAHEAAERVDTRCLWVYTTCQGRGGASLYAARPKLSCTHQRMAYIRFLHLRKYVQHDMADGTTVLEQKGQIKTCRRRNVHALVGGGCLRVRTFGMVFRLPEVAKVGLKKRLSVLVDQAVRKSLDIYLTQVRRSEGFAPSSREPVFV